MIQCPPDCAQNPFGFANYARFRDLESRWFDDALKRARRVGATPPPPPPPNQGPGSSVFQELAEVQFVMTALLGKGPVAAGSQLEQWAVDPSAALSNDERLLTGFRTSTRATVVEVQRHREGDQCTAIDVFEPGKGEFVIFHPTLAHTPRYSRHFGWFTWFPHFVHPLGHMIELVPHLWYPWRNDVLHELRNRHNMDYSMTLQRFLRENFCKAVELVGALVEEWEAGTSDVDPGNHYSAVYTVVAQIPTIAARFASHPACAPWMVLPQHPTYGPCHGEYRFRIRGNAEQLAACEPYIGSEKDGPNERTVGMFSLYGKVLLFHCGCRPAFARGKQLLDEEFKDLLQFDRDDILDVMANLKQEPTIALEPLPFASPLSTAEAAGRGLAGRTPPAPTEFQGQLDVLQQLVREHHQRTFGKFLDAPHVFLDDKTPREASRSTADRELLVDLMKAALYELDVRNRQFLLDLNIDASLQELGLQELI